MLSNLFHTVVYVPIYNLLIFLVDVVPGGDVGLAVVLVTVIVKLVLMPLSLSAAHTQRRMKLIEPKIKELREKYKDDKQQQALQTMALYREHNLRPFASILGALIQLPIIFALYFVSRKALLAADPALLYSFVHVPATLSPQFLGIFELTGHNIFLAVIAALAQFALAYFSIPVPPPSKGGGAAEDFGRVLSLQARFVLPLVIGAVSFTSGAVALYFITSSLVGLVQEAVVRRMKHPAPLAS